MNSDSEITEYSDCQSASSAIRDVNYTAKFLAEFMVQHSSLPFISSRNSHRSTRDTLARF